MSNESIPAKLEELADLLQRHGVRFVVIGGQAEYIFGSPRVTFDIDLCYERSDENLARLATALKELAVSLRDAPKDLPFTPDARTLKLGSNFTFETSLGDLDLLGHVEPVGDFDAVDQRAGSYSLGSQVVRVIDLDDLIRVKEHVGRKKDRESLHHLLAIKKLRETPGSANESSSENKENDPRIHTNEYE